MIILYSGIAGITVGLALAALSAGSFATPSQSSDAQPQQTTDEKAITSIRGPTAFLSAGGRSAVTIDAEIKELSLKRGESATVSLEIKHLVADNGFESLQLVPAGARGNLGLPSSAAAMTPEERSELIKEGKPIPGIIPLSSFVSYSDSLVTVNAGETKSIQMTISIPSSLPDEMLQKSIHISPDLTIVEMLAASPDRASDAIVYSDMVTVTVVG